MKYDSFVESGKIQTKQYKAPLLFAVGRRLIKYSLTDGILAAGSCKLEMKSREACSEVPWCKIMDDKSNDMNTRTIIEKSDQVG